MKNQRIATLLLAAEPSTLLSEFNKLLSPKQRQSSLRRMAQDILATNIGPTIVVLGHEAQKVHGDIYDLNVEFVLDTGYKKGSLSALQTGLKNYAGAMDAFIVASAKCTNVSKRNISGLANYYARTPGRMLATFHRSSKDSPVLLSADFAAEIRGQSLHTGQEVKDIFRRHPQYVHLVEPPELRYQPHPRDFEFMGHE